MHVCLYVFLVGRAMWRVGPKRRQEAESQALAEIAVRHTHHRLSIPGDAQHTHQPLALFC